jgi:imidazolonepropionase-like amidohydrolase
MLNMEDTKMKFNRFFANVWMVSALVCIPVNAEQTAFVGVNVLSIDAGEVLEDQTVVVQDGRIVAMGLRDSAAVPDDATEIDGTGKYLMPGLADMHVHLMNQEMITALTKKEGPIQPIENMLHLYLANGVTTVRVMAGYPELLELRDAIARGEVLGPRLIVTTPLLDGPKPIWPAPLSRSIPNADAARAVVQEAKRDGYDMIKVYTLLSRAAYDAIIEEAEKVNLKVVGHVPVLVGQERVFESGQAEITHAEEYWRFTRNYGDEVVDRFTAMTKESGMWFSPTLTTYRDQMTDGETVMGRPENRYLEPRILEFWATRVPPASTNEKAQARWDQQVEVLGGFMRRLVKSLYDAGVPLMTGTDALNPMAVPGFSMHRELGEFVDAGISIQDSLRAATSGPAKFMEETDDWGTVAIGQRADLVLLNANPLEDIANTKKIEGVMVRGQWLMGEAMQQRLDEFADEYAKQ